MILREAGPDDAEAIARVHVEGWRTAYRGLLPDAFLDGLSVENRTAFWRRPLTTRPEGWHMLVAEQGGETVGFCCGSKEWDEPLPGCEGHINALYVLSAQRGQGIGLQLLAAMFGRLAADGRRSVSLWVLDGNHRSEAWYRSLGARELMRAAKPSPVGPVPEIALGWDEPGMDGVIARRAA